MSSDTKSDIYMALTGIAIGVVIVILVMGAEFVHILTRVSSIGGF